MSYQPLLMSGIILGKSSGGMSIGTPITGADNNAILTTDSAGNLSDKVLTSGQILIGSTGAAPVPATLTGTLSQILISSNAGSITLSLPQNIGTSSNVIFGSVSLQPSGSLDTTAAGTLAIGTNNASIINIGNSGATVNIQGTVLYENVTQLQVKDPLITLNKGAGAGSASGAGIEIEEAGIITAFSKTSADRLSYTFKAPATAGIVTVTPGSSGITLNQSSHDPVTLGTPSGLSLSSQVLSLAVATSTVTGALLSTDWSTFNSKQPAGNYLTALTGDGTAAGPGSSLLTLSTVNTTPGTFGSNSSVNTTTVNAKGLVTTIVNNPILITESQVTNLVSDLAGKQPVGNYVTALIGDVTASGPGSAIATLATVNAAPGTTGSASTTSTITTNAKGLVTVNTSTPIQITESQVTNLVSDLAGKQPVGNYVTALTGDGSASGPGSAAFTLATVNLSPGVTGSASSTSVITTNGKGLVTTNTSTPIQITESQVTGLVSDLASKVTAVSVTTLNGLAGTSSGGPTPALTLSTTVTGVLKGNGTAISAAVSGVDYQPAGAYVTSLTGDATGSGPGATALTLATVNATPGTTGSVSSTSIIVTNAKGLVTSNTNTPIQISEAQVTNLVSDLAGKQPTGNYITALTGDATASGPGSAVITLATVNATPGVYGTASSHPVITVNAKGLSTTVTSTPIQIAESQVTNLVSDLAGKQPTGNYITALTGDVIANGPGSSSAVVNSVGGATSTSVATAASSVAAATDATTASTLIKRDGLGNFQVITQNSASSTTLPASTAFVQAATALYIPLTQKGAANGVAPLDATSKIPASYLPSYVDEVQPYANLAAFPATGATNVIYIANDTNKVYRWTGSSYIEISASPGSTDAVPEGSVNLYYTVARFNTAFATKTTTNLTEGSNLYFTTARASAAAPVQSVSGRTGAVVLTNADVGLSNVLNLDQTNPANIVQTATYRFSTDVEKAYWNAKQPAGAYITALTGDVTASGPGSSAATVVTVGGASASSVAISVSSTLAATSLSTVSTLVKRDATGASNFKLLNLDGSTSGTIALAASATQTAYTITLPSAAPTTGTALVYNGTSYVWSAPTTTGITALTGDVTATGPGSSAATLATVNASPGIFGSASSVNTITVNAKGLVTSITNAPIQIAESQVTNLVTDLAGKQPTGNYITALTGDATAAGPGSSAITLATVNASLGTFNNVTVNAKGLVTSASNVAYAPGNAGDISPSSFSGLANNTANQSITGLSFSTTISTFEALLNIQISATTNTFTTVSIFGTRRAAGTWTSADIASSVRSDMITGLAFSITAAGVVTISVGAIAGFTSGIIKYRALTLS